ncbi:hypothetical protein FRC01_002546 [Tulasnella sp. 417]|nr:hypothetical protein FRC01_002546 [Tulasnella sp. 417]
MVFSSIVALRQTCRRCYNISKTTALWLNIHRWITEGAEDWRTPLAECRPLLSGDELERAVIRLVTFERNWSRGSLGARRTSQFDLPGGFVGVMLYDLDAFDIQGVMLIEQDREIWAIDFSSDNHFMGPGFELTLEFGTSGFIPSEKYLDPRDMTIWRVSLDESGHLAARLDLPAHVPDYFPTVASSVSPDLGLRYTPRPIFSGRSHLSSGRMCLDLSNILRAPVGDWATFGAHNGERLFSFRIPLRSDLEPKATSESFGQIGLTSRIGLGTSHGIVSTLRKKEVDLYALDYHPGMWRLLSFAGVELGNRTPETPSQVSRTTFVSPYPTTADPWLLDERSGRVLCVLATEPKRYGVFYFVD